MRGNFRDCVTLLVIVDAKSRLQASRLDYNTLDPCDHRVQLVCRNFHDGGAIVCGLPAGHRQYRSGSRLCGSRKPSPHLEKPMGLSG